MSGILAASQSRGCCCRPVEGCTCGDPNRPGAVIDRTITAINVEAEVGVIESARQNSASNFCGCDCLSGDVFCMGEYGPYRYRSAGSVIDPDPVFGDSQCEPFGCIGGGCAGCPEYRVNANFDNQTLMRVNVAYTYPVWTTFFADSFDHICGTWNWAPRNVGYCQAIDCQNVRVRRYCPFPGIGGVVNFLGPFPPYPGNLFDPPPGNPDPNGAYINLETGEYLGTNTGLCRTYAFATVRWSPSRCAYICSIALRHIFQVDMASRIGASGELYGIEIDDNSTITLAHYEKPCFSPFDTVIGTYRRVWGLDSDFSRVDPECGANRWFYNQEIVTSPFISVS